MQIDVFELGALMTNAYLLSHKGQALCIDPGGDPGPVLMALHKRKLTLSHILLTHLHCDHTGGVTKLAEETGAEVMAAKEDAYLFDTPLGQGGTMGLSEVRAFPFTPIKSGHHTFLGLAMEVLHVPGHSLGSLAFYFPQTGDIFVGDVLFQRSIGRTDFPGGDTGTLISTIREKLFSLPEETTVWSGHGPKTTIGDEKLHNPFLR